MKRFRTPQEKKLLRYEKDGRNTYAEARAASRKSIALRKAKASRSLRHAQNTATARPGATLDEADLAVRKTPKNSWRKIPDSPLAEYVGRILRRRGLNGMTLARPASVLLLKSRRNLIARLKHFKGPLQHDIE